MRLDSDVLTGCVVGDVLVVALEVPPGGMMTENVFAISLEGEVLWQVERIPETAQPPFRYSHVNPIGRDRVGLWNWACWSVEVDIHTGHVLSKRWTK